MAAVVLSFAAFMATLGALSVPMVHGAVVRPAFVSTFQPPAEKRPQQFGYIVVAAQPTQPTVHLASWPAGARVLDARGELIGIAPLEVRSPDGALTAELVLAREGYREKHVSVSFANQSVLAVMAHAEKKKVTKR